MRISMNPILSREVVYDVRLTSLAEEKTEDSKNSFRFTVKFASYSQRVKFESSFEL